MRRLTNLFSMWLIMSLLLISVRLFADAQDVHAYEDCSKYGNLYNNMDEKQLWQESMQDSLRHLVETGQTDTIHYNYRKGSFISSDSLFSKIIVTPRIDSIENRTGHKNAGIVLLLLLMSASLAYVFARLAAKYAYKKMLFMPPLYYGLHIIVGLLVIYPILSDIYTNLDDMMVREHGKAQRAALSIKWGQYKSRNQYHSTRQNSFLFPGKDGIMLSVSRGRVEFDADRYPNWGPGGKKDKDGIPVRYDAATHKLSVDDSTCSTWNLYGIAWGCSLLFFIFWLSYGKCNGFLRRMWSKL